MRLCVGIFPAVARRGTLKGIPALAARMPHQNGPYRVVFSIITQQCTVRTLPNSLTQTGLSRAKKIGHLHLLNNRPVLASTILARKAVKAGQSRQNERSLVRAQIGVSIFPLKD